MRMGLLYRNFSDAVSEGDGERVCLMWKYFTLHFHAYGKTKYALEGLFLAARLGFTLSARKAEQLKWNRFVNVPGHLGKNKSLDLHLEHLNNYTKKLLKRLEANLTERAAVRSSQSAGVMKILETHLRSETKTREAHGRHGTPKTQTDFQELMKELRAIRATSFIPGRAHKSFPEFHSDVLFKLSLPKMSRWVKEHKRKIETRRGDFLV